MNSLKRVNGVLALIWRGTGFVSVKLSPSGHTLHTMHLGRRVGGIAVATFKGGPNFGWRIPRSRWWVWFFPGVQS